MKRLLLAFAISSRPILAAQCDIQISEGLPSDCYPIIVTSPCGDFGPPGALCQTEGTKCPSLENPKPQKAPTAPEPPKNPEVPKEPETPQDPEAPETPETPEIPEAPETPPNTPDVPPSPPEAPPPESPEPETPPPPSDSGGGNDPGSFTVVQTEPGTKEKNIWSPLKTGKADCSDPHVKCVDRAPTADASSLLEIRVTKGSADCEDGRCTPVEKLPPETSSVVDRLKAAAKSGRGCANPNATCTAPDPIPIKTRDECGRLVTPLQENITVNLKNILKGSQTSAPSSGIGPIKLTPFRPKCDGSPIVCSLRP